MKQVYVDTSVILAKWIKNDPFHEECNKIIDAIENKKIRGIFSGLGLAEVSSVVERQYNKFSLDLPEKISLNIEYLKKIVMVPQLEIVDIITPINTIIAGSTIKLSMIHFQSLDLSPKFHLKTLDALHLAICVLISKLKGKQIDYFVTGDHEIISNTNRIKSEYGFSTVFPNDLIRLEGL